ncbi:MULTISPECIES: sigma 54-interacting transcriptional regulator [Rhodomicrobium]|uniref:sigma 54-interacting transcriptional regulator n=1 Tax=Rhodomicrobium TaxID=1068 RepID=UPI001124D6E5|nr:MULTISPECIES: sigma 54-interacting transcriptional regulator [Rhodomicrobium]
MSDRTQAGGLANFLWDFGLESSEAAALIVDPVANRIHQHNRAMLALVGAAPDRLTGAKVSDIFSRHLPKLVALTEECLDRGTAWSDDLALGIDGGPLRDVELFASRFQLGETRLILFLIFDKRELRLRRSERDLFQLFKGETPNLKHLESVFRNLERGNRLILDAVGEGIYGVDTEGKATFLNPAAERMLGWRADELVGQIVHNVVHYSHADGEPYPLTCCPIYAAFHDGAVHRVDHEVFWRKDGTAFPVEYISTPIKHGGRSVGAVVVFRDVSERRTAERRLRGALQEIEELKKRLELENAYLQDELKSEHNYKEIVGNSHAIRTIIEQIELVAATDASVLITGESGTGKELIARAIHENSPRGKRPLIRVNCAAIPRELFESEFFGHVKGAFTGAVGERVGRFELADGGTIFLDEVGELPLEQQAKFLRVLQEGQFERLGDGRTHSVNVRVIAATNKNLKAAVAAKAFREDLYFRLNVFPVEAPPLRQRLDDIPLLAAHFIGKICKRLNKGPVVMTRGEIERMQAYDWPGNIRELENVIERAVIVSRDGKLRVDLPLAGKDGARQRPAPGAAGILTEDQQRLGEHANLINALRSCGGRVAGPGGAAELLGVKPTTLYSRLKRFSIDAKACVQAEAS